MERALPLRALLLSIPVQLVALGAALSIHWIVPDSIFAGTGSGWGIVLLLQTLFAATIAHLLGFSRPWVGMNGCLPLAATISIGASVSPLPFLVGGAVMALLFLPALWSRVPYYPTSHEVDERLLALLPDECTSSFVDLGCGFGALLFRIAPHRPLIRFVGVELSPLAFAIAKIRSLLRPKGNVEIHFRSLWAEPLRDYTYVYCFLAPPPMEQLWNKVRAEMQSDAVFISNTFPAPAIPNMIEALTDERQNALYVYQM